jgi:hypothetical protein
LVPIEVRMLDGLRRMEPFEWAVPSQNFIRNRNPDDF